MKAVAIAAVFFVSAAVAHAGEMKAVDMKDMSPSGMAKEAKPRKHVAKGTVKNVDPKAGTVILDHEAVKSLNWPAMSMTFKLQDEKLMDKLPQGKKVDVEFEQRGRDYVITSVKP